MENGEYVFYQGRGSLAGCSNACAHARTGRLPCDAPPSNPFNDILLSSNVSGDTWKLLIVDHPQSHNRTTMTLQAMNPNLPILHGGATDLMTSSCESSVG